MQMVVTHLPNSGFLGKFDSVLTDDGLSANGRFLVKLHMTDP